MGRDRLWCGGYTDAIAAAVTRDLCLVLVLGYLELIAVGWDARTAVLHCRGCGSVGHGVGCAKLPLES